MESKNLLFASVYAAAMSCVGTFSVSAQLPGLTTENFASGFARPLACVTDPTNPNVCFVVQQNGLIRVLVDGQTQAQNFINLSNVVSQSGNERGLFSLAFSPNYATDGYFFVNYTATAANHATRVVRYSRDANDPLKADPNSTFIILQINQPFSNHNGGHIAFGPDGYLYIGTGDGGSGGDPGNRAQNPNTLLGKMLRIDPFNKDNGLNYAIPADNPFVDNDPIDAREEIWAFGIRNPWRWNFDNVTLGGTGALVMADVGQNAWEEIDYEPAGAGGRNYGWRRWEGNSLFSNGTQLAYGPQEGDRPFHVYAHGIGRSITGGYVYRGCLLGSAFRGRYFFADFVDRKIWSAGLNIDENGEATLADIVNHTAELGGSNFIGNVASFAEDASGELYIVSFNGTIRKIVPQGMPTLINTSLLYGTQVSGGLAEVLEPDDTYWTINSNVGFLVQEPEFNNVRFLATATTETPVTLDVCVETAQNQPNPGMGKVELFNFVSGAWVTIGTHPVTNRDTRYLFENIANPAEYVRAGDRLLRMRSKHVHVAVFTPLGFDSRYDHVFIGALE